MGERTFEYSIDRQDRIVSVSDPWLEFAIENEAPELTRDFVVGRSIWSFIDGRETCALFEDLFQQLRRRGEPIELPFRCDSPDRFRFMRLTLRPGVNDSVECVSVLEREQERPFYSILDRAFPRTRASLSICSVCKRIYAFDSRWLELEDAIRELDLFESAHLPVLLQTVCDECRAVSRRVSGGPAAA